MYCERGKAECMNPHIFYWVEKGEAIASSTFPLFVYFQSKFLQIGVFICGCVSRHERAICVRNL